MTRQLIATLLLFPAISLCSCSSGSPPPTFTSSGGTGSSTVGTGATPAEATGCQAGQMSCNGACVDILGSNANCGSCGNVCGTGQQCQNGMCQCSPGLQPCNGTCVDLVADANNCGICGNVCPTGTFCSQSTCGNTCGNGETPCGQSCVDLMSNVQHCGACDNACLAGQGCIGGTCSCSDGQVDCGTGCTDLMTDSANCGSCGMACAAGQSCQAGACVGTPAGTGGSSSGAGGAVNASGGTSAVGGGTPTGGTSGGGSPTGGGGGTGAVPEVLGGYHEHGDWAGFAFTFATEATITPTSYVDMMVDGPYCGQGTVQGTTEYTSIAAVGFNTNQARVEDAPVNTVVSTGTGLMINISNAGGSPSLRVQIEDGTDPSDPNAAEHRWCVNISDFDTDLIIPWESFNTECWDPDTGTAFNPSTALAKVIVYLPDNGATSQDFNFCVNDIGPANVVSRGTGQVVSSCGNSVSWTGSSLSGTDGFLTTDGAYGLQANAWGGGNLSISALGGCGFRVDATDCNQTEPTAGPCSFPSVYRGTRYGGNNTSSGGFPRQVSAISSIPTCLGWSSGSGDGYNVSFDVWFSGSSGATTPEKYLMLWFRTPTNWQPAGDFPEADGVVIGDQVWSRWYGPNTDGQYVVSYASPGPRAEGQAYSFNLKDFIDDAVEQGHVSSSDYLISVMGGIEIWAGGQGASIDGFSTEVQ